MIAGAMILQPPTLQFCIVEHMVGVGVGVARQGAGDFQVRVHGARDHCSVWPRRATRTVNAVVALHDVVLRLLVFLLHVVVEAVSAQKVLGLFISALNALRDCRFLHAKHTHSQLNQAPGLLEVLRLSAALHLQAHVPQHLLRHGHLPMRLSHLHELLEYSRDAEAGGGVVLQAIYDELRPLSLQLRGPRAISLRSRIEVLEHILPLAFNEVKVQVAPVLTDQRDLPQCQLQQHHAQGKHFCALSKRFTRIIIRTAVPHCTHTASYRRHLVRTLLTGSRHELRQATVYQLSF
mmetsp:Transcript_20882/g.35195  ORF Transcript_20882/g.35195 Transcript_20882/m.35195 type:complete len:292 (+) Transcript_20882:310-1185(+)